MELAGDGDMADDCPCLDEAPRWPDFEETVIGVDQTNGRHAEVETHECSRCGRLWLKYLLEDEAFSRSGRWYSGVVTTDQLEDLTPAEAPGVLELLPWYLVGGSFFDGKISRHSGSLPDLWP